LNARQPPKTELMTKPESRRRSSTLTPLVALLLGASALVAPHAVRAQPIVEAAQAGRVDRILVRGNERIEQSTVLSYLPIQAGTAVTEEQVGLAVTALFESNLFANVNIVLQGTDLVVTVVENPIINRVIFEGDKALKEDKLRDEVTARPRGIFTRARIQQDVQRIIELYRRAGRISATVTPKIVELPQKRVDVVFEIDEGPKSGVLDINFLGNREFSDNELADIITTEKSVFYKFFSSNANYDPDRIEYDEQQLRDHYRNRGFYDFRVISSVAELKQDQNGFAITYTLEEGRQYQFGKLTVETQLQKLDGAILQRLLPIREGDLYSDERIEGATDSLTFAAGSAGFAFVDIRPRFTPNRETGLIDVVFQIEEGPRVYIERIDIVGNTQTLDRVIRREMEIAEGDAFNRVLVDRSRNRIRSLTFFKDVTIDESPGSAPDKTNLRVQIEEQPTGELAFSAGYSSIDQLVIDLSVIQRNFRGRGQNLRARVSTGSFRKSIDFAFTEPKFLGRNMSAGVEAYSFTYDFSEQTGYETSSNGLGLRVGFPLSLNSSLGLRYTLRTDDIQVVGVNCSGLFGNPPICSQIGSKLTSSVGYTWVLDRRNDPINPTRGFATTLSQDIAGLGGDVQYVRTEVENSAYYGFNKDFILKVNAQAGYIEGFGGQNVRINDRFFKGGNSFRGFETAGIGPRDTSFDNAIGAKMYVIGTVELKVPNFLPEQFGVKTALFTDFGVVGDVDQADKISCSTFSPPTCVINDAIRDERVLRASAGISIGWRSPLGPIQFDISKVLAEDYYDRTETFRFSTSTRF